MADRLASARAGLGTPMVDHRHGLAVHPVVALSPDIRARMLSLLRSCYGNVTEDQFEEDLADKEWVIVGTDTRGGDVWLFSTLKRLYLDDAGRQVIAFYSGDTASRADARGGATYAGARLIVKKMFSEVASAPEADYYWFMISSTYKSYRLLSGLFRDFAPGPDRPLTDAERRHLIRLSSIKGFDYDAVGSIVRFPNASLPKDDGSASSAVGRGDRMATFFATANPGAATGERLASLTRLSLENLTPLGLRFVLGSDADCE